ncbi:MAG: hypothetical protein ACKO96_20255 [Flammeovirgaceae bacterium]
MGPTAKFGDSDSKERAVVALPSVDGVLPAHGELVQPAASEYTIGGSVLVPPVVSAVISVEMPREE